MMRHGFIRFWWVNVFNVRHPSGHQHDVARPRKEGFQKKAQIDMEGVNTVLQLRSKYGLPKKNLTDAVRYYDASFYNQAMQRR